MPPILVFDVNETLLDLAAFDASFDQYFGDVAVRHEWFDQMLLIAFTTAITGPYADFGTIGRAALGVVERRYHRSLSDEERSQILGTIRRLAPHPDVEGGLRRLQQGGLRMVTLTNSTAQVAEAQLAHAGLSHYFERVFSADSVRSLKPSSVPYRMVAEKMSVDIGSLLLVAAHAWDIVGAISAGCRAAFIERPGRFLDALTPRPDYAAANLELLADQILRQERLDR
ncbi:MAG TPA: haloacid dehalogenase type II [bacterium]|jgi:2-haloacid dehalogenase|nr:haloacid dehalogenase type II [bacterium]